MLRERNHTLNRFFLRFIDTKQQDDGGKKPFGPTLIEKTQKKSKHRSFAHVSFLFRSSESPNIGIKMTAINCLTQCIEHFFLKFFLKRAFGNQIFFRVFLPEPYFLSR